MILWLILCHRQREARLCFVLTGVRKLKDGCFSSSFQRRVTIQQECFIHILQKTALATEHRGSLLTPSYTRSEKIMRLKDIKVDWTTVASVLALQVACYFLPPLWRDQENCVVFSQLMLSSELLQPSWAPPHTQHLTWALTFHATVAVMGNNPTLCTPACTDTFYITWALEFDSLNHLCLQHHCRVSLTWKIHLTASIHFRGLISLLKMGSISLIYFTAFEN